MAVSFFKKSFSAAYYGYQNKITNPDTVEDEEEDESDEDDHNSRSSTSVESNKNSVQRLVKSKSAIEIVNLAKKNLVDKLSTNVTKLATYDHHSLLKSIQKDDDDSAQEEEDEYDEKNDQLKEYISFNLYEQGPIQLKSNQPFGLINPQSLPIELKEQLMKSEKVTLNDDEDDDESSDEYDKIDFNKYDEYGFLKKTFKKKEEEQQQQATNDQTNDLLLLKMDDTEQVIYDDDVVEKEDKEEKKGDGNEKQNVAVQNEEEEKQNDKLKNRWLTYLELTYNQLNESTTKWYQIESKIKHTTQLDNLIEAGAIPYFLRNQLWARFSNAYLMKEKCEYNYNQLCKKSSHIRNFNEQKHSLRILPNNICFQDQSNKLNQSLRRILRVIKWIERNGIDPICDYNNNLNRLNLPLITAYLLLVFNEEDAFWLLLSILNEWKLIFIDKNTQLLTTSNSNTSNNKNQNVDLIKNLIEKYFPELNEKLNQEEIDINVLVNSWLTSLLADVINDTHILFFIWDLLFYYGFIVIFQIIFGLLINKKDQLINKSTSSVDLINTISCLPDQLNTIDKVKQIWRLGKESLNNLDQEFYIIKNQNELQGELLRIGVPAVQLFNENIGGIRLLPQSNSLNRLSDLNKELKYKNVRQSAILMELHESIIAISAHFQSNEIDSKFDLTIDYNIKEVNKFYNKHKTGLTHNKNKSSSTSTSLNDNYIGVTTTNDGGVKKKEKLKRARALIDFKRIDDDELGFRKNDIIKILDDRDEHCWLGELNDQQGLFPSKFVQVLNENYCSYSSYGDDMVTPFINDLVRGRLCAVIKCILNNGLRRDYLSYFYNVHPWMIIENLAKNYMKTQQNNICSKLVLTKTFKLDDFENANNLNVRELFYKSILLINETHMNEAMDVKLRSLICVALNHKILAEWFTIYVNEDKNLIKSYYHNWSYVTTPVWQMIKLEFALLKQFPFNLNPNAELIQKYPQNSSVSKAVVSDMLVKHHLFSWDLTG